jgi:hypothetical protein
MAQSPTSLEDRIMRLYIILNGPLSTTGSCEILVASDEWGTATGIECHKDGNVCWFISKEDLLFDYTTRFM